MVKTLLRRRRALVISIDLLLVVLASYFAFWLRFDGAIPEPEMALYMQMLPWLVAVRGLTFVPCRVYGGLWRYTGIWDLSSIIAGVGSSTLVFYLLVHWGFGILVYPRSVFLIDAILLIFFMGGIRLTPRIIRELAHAKRGKRVLIFGAGDAGEMIVRDMMKYEGYDPIGFVDDDLTKVGQRIHGVKVLGTQRDLPRIIPAEKPHEVLLAIPRGDPATIRRVVNVLQPFKVPITTLPNLRDLLNGKVAVQQIRSLSIEDLLPRAPVGLEAERVRHFISETRVLVTGAGGSIGSELCRQIAALNPSVLVLYERYENGLYAIANDLSDQHGSATVCSIIGDVTDAQRLNAVVQEYAPHIIFHAAAHKHVPLMELNVCEAVKNNVIGTRMLAEAAERHRVERFVLISSDKAVNPSSVMGATKRVAELIVQAKAAQSATSFVTVRFGNVLGSNGSVVPRFLEQIKAGGPVTVTHPEIRRYFMMISEAVQLVLQAAALGKEAEMFVLDMGDQISVLEMARNLIRLSGFVPDEEIPITFVGLRPGEKLFEELVGIGENLEPSPVEKVLRVRSNTHPEESFLAKEITNLELLAAQGATAPVIQQLCELVPTFEPWSKSAGRKGQSEPTPRLFPAATIRSGAVAS